MINVREPSSVHAIDPVWTRLAQGGVHMVTTRGACEITYYVYVGAGLLAGDRSDARKVWQRTVPFGSPDRTCAGGYDFVAAAREQQRIADRYARAAQETR